MGGEIEGFAGMLPTYCDRGDRQYGALVQGERAGRLSKRRQVRPSARSTYSVTRKQMSTVPNSTDSRRSATTTTGPPAPVRLI